jgi:lysophospholipase L1-like esterase
MKRRIGFPLMVSAMTIGIAAVAPAGAQAPDPASPLLSRLCQPGATALAADIALPNVAAALAQRKSVRILSFGAAPGRVGVRGDYNDVIESMIERTLKGIDVVMVNRGVSGELAASAAFRMKNEVALNEPDLVLWQVGTNDALAYVPADEFAETVRAQIAWLKAHKIDVVLVGLQFASELRRDAHYALIRTTLRKMASAADVPVIRFYEAMQIVNAPTQEAPSAEDFERSDAGYNCLAQYVARAITLGAFAKSIKRRP